MANRARIVGPADLRFEEGDFPGQAPSGSIDYGLPQRTGNGSAGAYQKRVENYAGQRDSDWQPLNVCGIEIKFIGDAPIPIQPSDRVSVSEAVVRGTNRSSKHSRRLVEAGQRFPAPESREEDNILYIPNDVYKDSF